MGARGEIYTEKLELTNGKRTYFFNVKENRNGDMFLALVESIRKFDDRYERQQIVIYEEHIELFVDVMNRVFDFMKKESPYYGAKKSEASKKSLLKEEEEKEEEEKEEEEKEEEKEL